MNLVNCDKIEVKKCDIGIGVFAREDILEGDVIEIGVMTPLIKVDGNENPHLHYWGHDKKTWAASSGCLAFYNHNDDPDAKKCGDLKNNTIVVYALRHIKKGSEIRTKYMSKSWRKCFQDF
tara:strand:- start:51 stop:413 length:363 start_codon:yes stop_codon:yes gene_type:complete